MVPPQIPTYNFLSTLDILLRALRNNSEILSLAFGIDSPSLDARRASSTAAFNIFSAVSNSLAILPMSPACSDTGCILNPPYLCSWESNLEACMSLSGWGGGGGGGGTLCMETPCPSILGVCNLPRASAGVPGLGRGLAGIFPGRIILGVVGLGRTGRIVWDRTVCPVWDFTVCPV